MSKSETPAKYRAEPPKYEQKDWLYEQYWSKGMSMKEMAQACDSNHQDIRDAMDEHGIPRRRRSHAVDAGDYDPREEWTLDKSDEDNTVDWSEINE